MAHLPARSCCGPPTTSPNCNSSSTAPPRLHRHSVHQHYRCLLAGPHHAAQSRSRWLGIAKALPSGGSEQDPEALKRKYFSKSQDDEQEPSSTSASEQKQQQQQQQPNSSQQGQPNVLDVVNPYTLGRQARAAFDDIWSQVSNLASPTKRTSSMYIIDDVMEVGRDSAEFQTPNASNTTVLVVGATGRVGKVLVRKLLLRGYKVKALVRRREGKRSDIVELPQAVQVLQGDVGNMGDVQEAVKGVDKIIYCAAARTLLTSDLVRVEERGVMTVVKALQDEFHRNSKRKNQKFNSRAKKEVADFSKPYHQGRWDVTYVGNAADEGKAAAPLAREEFAWANRAVAEINEDSNLIFEGELVSKGAYAEVAAQLSQLLPGGEHRMNNTEGLALRLRGDGKQYVCVLTTEQGLKYAARVPTRPGYITVRLPFDVFRPQASNQPPLDPAHIRNIALRYDNRGRSNAVAAVRAAKGLSVEEVARREAKFSLEVDWIKALPAGVEPDVVLVSCAGQARPGMDEADLRKLVEAKRRGEENLRLSGLGYTIIRPGTLVEEPGGYKALVFDQGSRLSESISAADVADICLRALHEPEARNKTFEVSYEYQSGQGMAMFELVAKVQDKTGTASYLKNAVAGLAKNT